MSVSQMAKMIGRVGSIHVSGDMNVFVRVTDVKTSYGCVRYQITPLYGTGYTWVDADTIVLGAWSRD